MANETGSSSAVQVKSALEAMGVALRNENGKLRSMLNETEKITRQTVNAEVESKNNRFAQESLKDEIKSLKAKIRSAEKGKEKAVLERTEARKTNQKLDTDNTALKKNVDSLEKTTAALKSENANLKKELTKLTTKRDKVKSDVDRLKDLRSKYLAEIAEFKK